MENTAVKTSKEAPTWARKDWRVVHRALRTLARRRAQIDADEATWLRAAEVVQLWRPLGMASLIDYMERVLGYRPRTAQERLRVARALGELPALSQALARGDVSYSAVRELTRVVTPGTEERWLAAAMGKNLRELEDLVAGHRPGALPDDPPDPELRMYDVCMRLSGPTYARLRQAQVEMNEEHGRHLDEDAFMAAILDRALDARGSTKPTGRARYQIAVTICERCRQGWQDGGGARIAIGHTEVERAECDAQHIGSLDAATPERAHQDVSPAIARLVWRRDHGRCRVPGCRSARGLEIHHLVRRADGGTHEPANLILMCSSCHKAHHDGILTVTGTAARIEVRRWHPPDAPLEPGNAEPAHVGVGGVPVAKRAHVDARHGAARAPVDVALVRLQARAALVRLGWEAAVAREAVAAALAYLDEPVTLEALIREALRRCPVARGGA